MQAWGARGSTSVASWAEAHVRWPGEIGYTARRIRSAPASVAGLTAPTEVEGASLAIDAGSGAGFLTFILLFMLLWHPKLM